MNPKRRNRLVIVLFLLSGAAVTVALTLAALSDNLNMFYPPDQIVGGDAPTGATIRAGGMVLNGSLVRGGGDGLDVSFVLTDLKGAQFPVHYNGILPDLFREGQGVLVKGQLGADGVFHAREVLAKHDEKYMPPELADMKGSKVAGAGDGP